jgi:hypothetical protein
MAKKSFLWLGCADEKVKRPKNYPFRQESHWVKQIGGNPQGI